MRVAKERLRESARAGRGVAREEAGPGAATRVRDHFLAAGRDMGLADDTSVRNPLPVVAGYWPIGDEMDLRPLLERLDADGFPCALPVVGDRGAALTFRRWRPGLELEEGPFGTRQPPGHEPMVRPRVLVVPLLAFDDEGYRIGWGAGFYDRTLAHLRGLGPVLAVGAAYALQKVERVPRGPSDQPLDWAVTEAGPVRFDRSGDGDRPCES